MYELPYCPQVFVVLIPVPGVWATSVPRFVGALSLSHLTWSSTPPPLWHAPCGLLSVFPPAAPSPGWPDLGPRKQTSVSGSGWFKASSYVRKRCQTPTPDR